MLTEPYEQPEAILHMEEVQLLTIFHTQPIQFPAGGEEL
jgi:hypothetical protein